MILSTWRSHQKYNPPLLWSKGFSRYCDFRGPDSYWREDTDWNRLEPCNLTRPIREALAKFRTEH